MNEVLLIVLAYLIGSIPSSVWVSKYFFGIDIRDYGSGNAGATNTFRTLGPTWGSFVMVADMIKGIIAVKLVYLLPYYLDHPTQMVNLQIGLGLAAVVGHIFPIWAEFRGGKGRSEEHTSELQSQSNLVCRLLLEKKNMYSPTHEPLLRMKARLFTDARSTGAPRRFRASGGSSSLFDPTVAD